MSDDKKTTELNAVADAPTQEIQDDQDHIQTRRLGKEAYNAVKMAAVPGENSTMPMRAVSDSRTRTSPVPEAVLKRIRTERVSEAEFAEQSDIHNITTVDAQARFKTLDIPLEAITDDTINDDGPLATVRFKAEIDDDAKVLIPERFMGLLRVGQGVEVTITVLKKDDQ